MRNQVQSVFILCLRVTRVLLTVGIFSMLYFSCATVLVPNGGPKDSTPPKVTKYLPDSAATNFKSREINIVFDEYVQLKDVNNQLIISPPLEEQPEIKLEKNRVLHISFKKPLKENTTYTMNFGNSIADYNEGNVLEGFQYIFSTGSYIDSLFMAGKVEYAFDHKVEKGILVMLYDISGYDAGALDSLPYKTLPAYFTKTKPDGSFRINNIHPGKYRIFALKDDNKDYKYEESEFIAFADGPVEAGVKKDITLELFKESPKKLKLLKADALGYGHILLVFSKPTEDLKVKALNVSKVPTEFVEESKNEDSLHYWFDGITGDSLKLQLSESGKIFDTAEVHLMTKEQMNKNSKGEKFKLTFVTNVSPTTRQDLVNPVAIKFNHPLKEDARLDSLLKLIIDQKRRISEDKKNTQDSWIKFENPGARYLAIQPHHSFSNGSIPGSGPTGWQADTAYNFFIPPNTLTDIFGLKNDSIKISFKTQEEKYYGTLKLKLGELGDKFILQVLDSKDAIIKEEEQVTGGAVFFYNYLPPGNYKLKLIRDEDKSGDWTTGNYLQKKQPEKVIYYTQPLIVRSDWDLEIEWKVTDY